MKTGLGFWKPAASGGGPVFLSHNDLVSTSNGVAGTYTFPIGLGVPDANRAVVLMASGYRGAAHDITAWSIDDQPLSLIKTPVFGITSNFGRTIVGIGHVPAGTSGTLSATYTTAIPNGRISVYSVYNLSSLEPVDVTEYAVSSTAPGNQSFSISGAKDGAVLACLTSHRANDQVWNSGLTTDAVGILGVAAAWRYNHGHSLIAADGPHNFSCSVSGSSTNISKGMVAISLR